MMGIIPSGWKLPTFFDWLDNDCLKALFTTIGHGELNTFLQCAIIIRVRTIFAAVFQPGSNKDDNYIGNKKMTWEDHERTKTTQNGDKSWWPSLQRALYYSEMNLSEFETKLKFWWVLPIDIW